MKKGDKYFYLLLVAAVCGFAVGMVTEWPWSMTGHSAEFDSILIGYLRAVRPYLKIQLLIMMSGCTVYAFPCGSAVLLYAGGMMGSFLRNTVRLSGLPADWRMWLMALVSVSMMYLLIAAVLLACRKSRECDSIGKLTLRYGYQNLTLIGGNALLYLVNWLLNGWILLKSFQI